ncbi:MAG: hypothetical protein ACYDER_25580 [Ktedonobacteraceae bacterium]
MLRWSLTALLMFMVVLLMLLLLHVVTISRAASAPFVSVVVSVPVAPAASSPSSVVGRPSLLSSSSVVGRPSLSAHFIDAVLAVYHSSAVGLGQAMVADSLHFGIDDVYALAFFWHESQFGRFGVARVTRSLGNIVCTSGYPSCSGRFRSYASWQAGCLDWFRLLAVEYVPHGLTTVQRIVPVYAPSSENDVAAYVVAVMSAVSVWRAGRLEVQ